MSNEAEVKPGDFQIDPKELHTGNFIVDKAVDVAVKEINHLDLNHDGRPDVAELMEAEEKYQPEISQGAALVLKLGKAVDFEHLAKSIADAPWVKDKALVAEVAVEIGKMLNELAAAHQ